jgi:hypothetical protein
MLKGIVCLYLLGFERIFMIYKLTTRENQILKKLMKICRKVSEAKIQS